MHQSCRYSSLTTSLKRDEKKKTKRRVERNVKERNAIRTHMQWIIRCASKVKLSSSRYVICTKIVVGRSFPNPRYMSVEASGQKDDLLFITLQINFSLRVIVHEIFFSETISNCLQQSLFILLSM